MMLSRRLKWVAGSLAPLNKHILTIVWILCIAFQCTASQVVPFVIRNEDYRSNLSINNHSSSAANALFSLFLNTGEQIGESRANIPENGSLQINDVVSYFRGQSVEQPFEGYILIDADQRISAFLSQINLHSGDPGFVNAIDASKGSSRLVIPRVSFTRPWTSTSAILNLGLVPAVVELKLRDDSGAVVASAQKVIGPGNQLVTSSSSFNRPLDVKGSLEIISRDSVPLAAFCRITQEDKQVGGIFPAIDLSQGSQEFSLFSQLQPHQETVWVVLSNPGETVTDVRLDWIDSTGRQGPEKLLVLEAFQTRQIDLTTIAKSWKVSSYPGTVLVRAGHPIAGMTVCRNLLSDDLSFDYPVTGGVPDWLIPSVTFGKSFRSSLLLSNLGRAGTLVQLIPRQPSGEVASSGSVIYLQAQSTARLDRLASLLGVPEGFYGPVEITALQGQPLYASSQVGHSVSALSGTLKAVSNTLTFNRKVGDSALLQWVYDSRMISRVSEFRIYRTDTRGDTFVRIGVVPAHEREFRLPLSSPGKFIYFVTAFDGQAESLPSCAINLEIDPAV